MSNTVFYLGGILANQTMREMTIIAGNVTMTGNAPAVKIIAHDVAIYTGFRII